MIEIEHLSYRYPGDDVANEVEGDAPGLVLDDVSLRIDEGAFVLVVGPSGAGKSTLLRCLNGLVPHFYGGEIAGRVRVAGRDPIALAPRGMSETVGFVFQDPESQAVVDVVEDELVFAMENQGLPLPTMRTRVEEVLDQLHIAHLRRRPISTLSGGERQRVAIASVLTLHPQVLVLDEPTSQLDPQAAEEVLDTLVKLNHDLGLTIVLSEHRLERVVQYADQILYMPGPGEPPRIGDPRQMLSEIPLVPPLVELGRRLGWSPLPLTIKDARRHARAYLQAPHPGTAAGTPSALTPPRSCHCEAALFPPIAQHPAPFAGSNPQPAPEDPILSLAGGALPADTCAAPAVRRRGRRASPPWARSSAAPAAGAPPLQIEGLCFSYNGHQVLQGIDLTVQAGEVVALMGRNGAGKTTLLKQCMGLLKPDAGRVLVLGQDTRQVPVERIARRVGYVPQNPNALLFADTVAQELAFTRRAQGMPAAADPALLRTVGLEGVRERYPRDLSAGERQRVALAAVLVSDPELILLDEPTRGLDYAQKKALSTFLQDQQRAGKTVLIVTHDVELIAQCAQRVILLGEGEIVLDGPVREVMTGSQIFASQVNKLLRDPRYLTGADVVGDNVDGIAIAEMLDLDRGDARPCSPATGA